MEKKKLENFCNEMEGRLEIMKSRRPGAYY